MKNRVVWPGPKCGMILLVRLHLKLNSFVLRVVINKKLRPINIFRNNLNIMLLVQADVGSTKVCFTNASIFFQFLGSLIH